MLPIETFKTVIASTPLISIDLILRNNKQEVLLGQRLNRPAQGCWFVPGGRILKDEPIESAFKRILEAELGVKGQNINDKSIKFKGIYEHFYSDSVTGRDFSTHYVVMAYEVEFNGALGDLPLDQHSSYKWFSEVSVLMDNTVHKHTKWYFQKKRAGDASFLK